jgi:putative glutamine amidotransferase
MELPAFHGLVLGGGADIEPSKAGIQVDDLLPPKEAESDGDGRILAWLFAPLLLLFRGVLAIHHAEVDEARDSFEDRCLHLALENGRPVLGICRGAQLINIHFGGTLYPELSGFYGESGNPASVYPRKNVAIKENSLLSRIMGQNTLMVNSLHKQAVNELGEGITASGRDDSGVVQAIEADAHPWVLGVQWHPEFLPTLSKHQLIFRDLIASTRQSRADHR